MLVVEGPKTSAEEEVEEEGKEEGLSRRGVGGVMKGEAQRIGWGGRGDAVGGRRIWIAHEERFVGEGESKSSVVVVVVVLV